MPAYFDSGFSVREMPWHELGKVLDEYPGTWNEARVLAGLDWEPIEVPQFMGEVISVDEAGEPVYGNFQKVEEFKYIVRDDTHTRLDSANSTYEIISHAEMGRIVEAILDVPDVKVQYETAGVLHGGKKVWALARMGDLLEIKGDPSPQQRYLALLNSHDGTAALRAIGTTVRIVCANTWHAAETNSEQKGTAFSFKHTKNWKKHVEAAREAVTRAYQSTDAYVESVRELLNRRYTEAMEAEFIRQFAIERVIINSSKVNAGNVMEYLRNNPRVDASLVETTNALTAYLNSESCAGLAPTAYRVLQAAGEFADHGRNSLNKDTYFSRTMIDVEPLKKVATRLAMSVTG